MSPLIKKLSKKKNISTNGNISQKQENQSDLIESSGNESVQSALQKKSKLTRKERKQQERERKEALKAADAELAQARKNVRELGYEARLKAEARQEKVEARQASRDIRKAKSVQKMLAFENAYEDGIIMVRPGVYSRTIKFSDVGYQTAREDEQKMFLNHLCYLLNTCDDTVHLQLNLSNIPVPMDQFAESISIKDREGLASSEYAEEYNEMIRSKCAEQAHTLEQEKSYTVTIHAENLDRAKKQLATVCNSIEEELRACGSSYERLSGVERARQLAEILRPGEMFDFDFRSAYFEDITVKDYVAPYSLDLQPKRNDGRFKFGDKYGYMLYLRKYPAKAKDDFLPNLLDLAVPMHISVHYQAMDDDDAETRVQRKLTFMDQQRAHEGREAVKRGLDPSFVSSELLNNMDEASALLNALRTTEQKLFYTTIYIMLWADNEDDLEESVYQVTKMINKSAKAEPITLASQKRITLNSILPIGADYADIARALTTVEAALMSIPFAQIRMNDSGGVYYGVNSDSGEAVVLNRKNLKAPNGWVLAMPGRGKSFLVKREIYSVLEQNPNDEVLIIDPQNEYSILVDALGGQVIDLDPNKTENKSYLNPFDLESLYAGDGVNPIPFKSSFVITMIATLIGGEQGIDTVQQGIIDRCVRAVYEDYCGDWTTEDMPTFKDFYDVLKTQDEPEAKYLAKALDLYVEGNLNVFTHHTNIETHSRIRSYNTKSLPPALQTLGMLIVLDQVNNRAGYNFARGVRTWLYIDEAQNFFTNPHSIEYFDKTFSEGRKNLVIPTAITQNVDRVIGHDRARQMFSNSDFMMLLGQSKNDLDNHLVGILGLSAKEREHLLTDKPGQGILKAGNRRVCVKDSFPRNTKLYELFSTDPNEREEMFRAKARAAARSKKSTTTA